MDKSKVILLYQSISLIIIAYCSCVNQGCFDRPIQMHTVGNELFMVTKQLLHQGPGKMKLAPGGYAKIVLRKHKISKVGILVAALDLRCRCFPGWYEMRWSRLFRYGSEITRRCFLLASWRNLSVQSQRHISTPIRVTTRTWSSI